MMRRIEEITNPDSCTNKAKDNELLFVLMGRDKAAPETIRFWAQERIRLGKNEATDEQILDAEKCADVMELELEKAEVI